MNPAEPKNFKSEDQISARLNAREMAHDPKYPAFIEYGEKLERRLEQWPPEPMKLSEIPFKVFVELAMHMASHRPLPHKNYPPVAMPGKLIAGPMKLPLAIFNGYEAWLIACFLNSEQAERITPENCRNFCITVPLIDGEITLKHFTEMLPIPVVFQLEADLPTPGQSSRGASLER